jgi:hypothetical protein
MKHFFTTVFLTTLVVLTATGQSTRTASKALVGSKTTLSGVSGNMLSSSRAEGDTIFYFDGNGFGWADGVADEATFTSEVLDLDGLPINANIAPAFDAAEGYTFYYFLDSTSLGTTVTYDTTLVIDTLVTLVDSMVIDTNDTVDPPEYDTTYVVIDTLFTYEEISLIDSTVIEEFSVDTGNYFGCYSWFTTVAQADDWFIFGPVTIPDMGATLRWQHRIPDNDYRDGYEVLVSTSPESFDFVDKIYEVSDNDPITNGHTDWTSQQGIVPDAYVGQPTYFAFHHDATDMFILYLDEIALVETATAGIANNKDVAIGSAYPNPSNTFSTISYQLSGNSEVRINVIDVMGKVVSVSNEGTKQAGKHTAQIATADLAAGIYFVNLVIDGATYSTKITVAH